MNFNIEKYKLKYKIYVIEQYVKKDFMYQNDKEIYDEIYDMYNISRENLNITTLKIKPYNQVNKYYVKYIIQKFQKALQYYVMITVLEDQHLRNLYLQKFIKEFKTVNLKNPGINKFYKFEKHRLYKENHSLFNVNSNKPIQLFGNIITQNNSNNNVNVNVNEPFGSNPFV